MLYSTIDKFTAFSIHVSQVAVNTLFEQMSHQAIYSILIGPLTMQLHEFACVPAIVCRGKKIIFIDANELNCATFSLKKSDFQGVGGGLENATSWGFCNMTHNC